MLPKRNWLLIGMAGMICLITGWALASYYAPDNVSERQAAALGLTPTDFEILDTAIREYLYGRYPFLSDTDFGIRYEKLDADVEGVPPESLVVDAYANFRTPPVVVRATLYDGNVRIISETVINKGDA